MSIDKANINRLLTSIGNLGKGHDRLVLENTLRPLAKWRSQLLSNTAASQDSLTIQTGPFVRKSFVPKGFMQSDLRARRHLPTYTRTISIKMPNDFAKRAPSTISVHVNVDGLFAGTDFGRFSGTRTLVFMDIDGEKPTSSRPLHIQPSKISRLS